MDWFYRRAARAFMWVARKPVQRLDLLVGEAYRIVGLVPLMATARLSAWFDWHGIDGVVDGFARCVLSLSGQVRRLQAGRLQYNLLYAFLVAGIMVCWYILSN